MLLEACQPGNIFSKDGVDGVDDDFQDYSLSSHRT